VDPHVARRAVLETAVEQIVAGREREYAIALASEIIGAVVALQTDREHHGPFEQAGVRGPVWHVAGFASLDTHRGMLEYERTALVGVTLQARFFVPQRLVNHAGTSACSPGRRKRAVRVVAVRALYNALVDPVLEGHGELRSHGLMAPVTDVHLFPRKQKFGHRGMVYGMATGANHSVKRVFGPPDIGAGEVFAMAGQAGIQHLSRLHDGKCTNGGRAAACFHVRLAGSVAALATSSFRRFRAAGKAFIVRIFEEILPNVGVTSFTNVAADVSRVR
jgi:hypothetical protein